MDDLVYDVESYWDVFLVGLKRISDGKTVILEESARSKIDRTYLRHILLKSRMIGFNSQGYDSAVIWYFLENEDRTHEDVKRATNRIIGGGLKFWEVEDALGIRIPWDFKKNHIDLIEPQPNPFASLKVLHARMHGRQLRDLPYEPEARLTFEQIDQLRAYLHNDLEATENLWLAMAEPMELRKSIGESIGQNVMSKSDTQMGLAIIKKRAEELLGRKIEKYKGPIAGQVFRYTPPDYLKFEDPSLSELVKRISEHDFITDKDGKVVLPSFLNEPIEVGGMEWGRTIPGPEPIKYALGIGGLHSTEANRAMVSDDDHVLCDFDVASYYPAIIISLGLYPEAVGPEFSEIYGGIRKQRITAKKRVKEIDAELKALKAELAALEAQDGE